MIETKYTKQRKRQKRLEVNDRDEKFCRLIVQGKTQVDAYVAAGFGGKTKSIQNSASCELMKVPRIKNRIKLLRRKITQKYALTEKNIFKNTGAIANSDIRDYITWGGPNGPVLKNSDDLDDIQSLAVESVTIVSGKKGNTVKFKLHPKTKALETGAKLLGLLVEKKEITGKDGSPLTVEIVKFGDEESEKNTGSTAS